MARVPGKAKKLKMKDMYGVRKLQISLGLFQESDFFIQSPRLSRDDMKYGDLLKRTPCKRRM